MSGDQPTNQPTTNQPSVGNYISVRLTLSHELEDDICQKVFGDTDYIMYKHKSGTANEHFHVYVPVGDSGDCARVRERYRKRITTIYPNCRGNKGFSVKCYDNGVRSFIFYCHHEGAAPVFKGNYGAIIEEVVNAGVFEKRPEQRSGLGKRVRERLANPQLTLSNLLKQAYKYRNEHSLNEVHLGRIIQKMITDGWDPSLDLIRKGVPTEFYRIFYARIQRVDVPYQNWMDPHKSGERKMDYDEIDTDFKMVELPDFKPRPHE